MRRPGGFINGAGFRYIPYIILGTHKTARLFHLMRVSTAPRFRCEKHQSGRAPSQRRRMHMRVPRQALRPSYPAQVMRAVKCRHAVSSRVLAWESPFQHATYPSTALREEDQARVQCQVAIGRDRSRSPSTIPRCHVQSHSRYSHHAIFPGRSGQRRRRPSPRD